jgi:hypothetical protein
MLCYVMLSHNTLLSSIHAADLCMQVTASLVISSFASIALRVVANTRQILGMSGVRRSSRVMAAAAGAVPLAVVLAVVRLH